MFCEFPLNNKVNILLLLTKLKCCNSIRISLCLFHCLQILLSHQRIEISAKQNHLLRDCRLLKRLLSNALFYSILEHVNRKIQFSRNQNRPSDSKWLSEKKKMALGCVRRVWTLIIPQSIGNGGEQGKPICRSLFNLE